MLKVVAGNQRRVFGNAQDQRDRCAVLPGQGPGGIAQFECLITHFQRPVDDPVAFDFGGDVAAEINVHVVTRNGTFFGGVQRCQEILDALELANKTPCGLARCDKTCVAFYPRVFERRSHRVEGFEQFGHIVRLRHLNVTCQGVVKRVPRSQQKIKARGELHPLFLLFLEMQLKAAGEQSGVNLRMPIGEVVAGSTGGCLAHQLASARRLVHFGTKRAQELLQQQQTAVRVFEPVAFQVTVDGLPALRQNRVGIRRVQRADVRVCQLAQRLRALKLLAQVGCERSGIGHTKGRQHRAPVATPSFEVSSTHGVELGLRERVIHHAQSLQRIAGSERAQLLRTARSIEFGQQCLHLDHALAGGLVSHRLTARRIGRHGGANLLGARRLRGQVDHQLRKMGIECVLDADAGTARKRRQVFTEVAFAHITQCQRLVQPRKIPDDDGACWQRGHIAVACGRHEGLVEQGGQCVTQRGTLGRQDKAPFFLLPDDARLRPAKAQVELGAKFLESSLRPIAQLLCSRFTQQPVLRNPVDGLVISLAQHQTRLAHPPALAGGNQVFLVLDSGHHVAVARGRARKTATAREFWPLARQKLLGHHQLIIGKQTRVQLTACLGQCTAQRVLYGAEGNRQRIAVSRRLSEITQTAAHVGRQFCPQGIAHYHPQIFTVTHRRQSQAL